MALVIATDAAIAASLALMADLAAAGVDHDLCRSGQVQQALTRCRDFLKGQSTNGGLGGIIRKGWSAKAKCGNKQNAKQECTRE